MAVLTLHLSRIASHIPTPSAAPAVSPRIKMIGGPEGTKVVSAATNDCPMTSLTVSSSGGRSRKAVRRFLQSVEPRASRQRQIRTQERLSATTITAWPDASPRFEMDRGLTWRPRFSFLRSTTFNQPPRQRSALKERQIDRWLASLRNRLQLLFFDYLHCDIDKQPMKAVS
jgi:hypothetical protein